MSKQIIFNESKKRITVNGIQNLIEFIIKYCLFILIHKYFVLADSLNGILIPKLMSLEEVE